MKTAEHTHNVTEETFDELVLKRSHDKPVLVDFWAEWCAPCISLAPTLGKLVDEYCGRFELAKVEVDDNMHLAGHYKLRGFPTVIIFIDGAETERFSGNQPYSFIKQLIENAL